MRVPLVSPQFFLDCLLLSEPLRALPASNVTHSALYNNQSNLSLHLPLCTRLQFRSLHRYRLPSPFLLVTRRIRRNTNHSRSICNDPFPRSTMPCLIYLLLQKKYRLLTCHFLTWCRESHSGIQMPISLRFIPKIQSLPKLLANRWTRFMPPKQSLPVWQMNSRSHTPSPKKCRISSVTWKTMKSWTIHSLPLLSVHQTLLHQENL